MSAWTRLVDIFSLAGRPIAFFDFETASLSGNPCEFALVVLDSSGEPDNDEETYTVLESLGCHAHGVAYVSSSRLDPGQAFSPGASSVHGITAADVEGCPRFDDPQVIGLFQAMADNNVVWAGHNVFGFDLPLAERIGYIPAGWQAIDSMRLVRRIQAEEDTRPQVTNAMDPSHEVLPAMAGLDLFKASLTSTHYALTGQRFAGVHGALYDVCASIRVMAELVNLWFGEEVFIHFQTNTPTPEAAVDAIVKCFSQVPRDRVAWSGHLQPIDVDGVTFYEMARGKHRGMSLGEVSAEDPSHLEWAASKADPEEAEILTSLLTSKAAGTSGWLRWDQSLNDYTIAKGKNKGACLGVLAKNGTGYLSWILGLEDVDAETKSTINSALTPAPWPASPTGQLFDDEIPF